VSIPELIVAWSMDCVTRRTERIDGKKRKKKQVNRSESGREKDKKKEKEERKGRGGGGGGGGDGTSRMILQWIAPVVIYI
jgi:hypothetical protein